MKQLIHGIIDGKDKKMMLGAVVLWAYWSAYGAEGPGIESPWSQKIYKIYNCCICMFKI